jgi:hypothetical protein
MQSVKDKIISMWQDWNKPFKMFICILGVILFIALISNIF